MPSSLLGPPVAAPSQVEPLLRERGFAVLDASGVGAWLALPPAAFNGFAALWNDLPPDNHLKDGGHYRRRRHSCFIARGDSLEQTPHRPHWQPAQYNALHGGIERWFEPLAPAMTAHPVWRPLLLGLAALASQLRGAQPWFIEAHPFRINTEGGIGRPTPEGAHRDGVDLVAVILIDRRGIKGGETRVFDAGGPHGLRFTMTEPWTALLLDDARVIHESTPIQPDGDNADGHRDTLVVTLRAGGFQAAPGGF